MGHNIDLTIYKIDDRDYNCIKESINKLENILLQGENNTELELILDLRIVRELKYNTLESTKILCQTLIKNGITSFKIYQFD